eukprot:jgi/Bigna1/74851/fgenesh1_pg.31_\
MRLGKFLGGVRVSKTHTQTHKQTEKHKQKGTDTEAHKGKQMGFLAPKKIDPRLLDPSHVFKDVFELSMLMEMVHNNNNERVLDATTSEGPDVFHQKKAKRHREGYEEGATLLYKEVEALDFIKSEVPVDMLGKYNAFTFKGDESAKLKEHDETSEEVIACCSDLKVLGKKDFSNLLKWRMKLRKKFAEARAQEKKQQDGEGGEEDESEGEDF